MNPIRYIRTNSFLRQALEDAHHELSDCIVDLSMEQVHREQLETHLAIAVSAPCACCRELEDERDQAFAERDEAMKERDLWHEACQFMERVGFATRRTQA